MARVPISFYLNILAGILVFFNHYAASETGDVALNKVTGAAGRFYTLFRDTATTLQHGLISRLETVLCELTTDNVLPHNAAEFFRVRYCGGPAQNTENTGETLADQQPRGGYGSANFAFEYYQPSMQPLEPRISAGDPPRKPFSLSRPSQSHLSRVVWEWSSEIGMLLLRVWGSYWWFKAPLQMTGVLVAYAALSAFDYLIRANAVLRWVSQMYMSLVADFLQCIEWEARRHVVDIGVVVMEHVHGIVTRTRQRI